MFHHHGDPDIRTECRVAAKKFARRDANNGIGVSVQPNLLPYDSGVSSETVLPEVIANHGNRRPARSFSFCRQKTAPEHKLYAKCIEIVFRNYCSPDSLGLIVVRQAYGIDGGGHQTGEGVIAFAQIAVVRVGKSRKGSIAGTARQRHYMRLVGHARQGIQQRCIDPTEDRAVSSDAKRQSQNNDSREAQMFSQSSECIASVLEDYVHRRQAAQFAIFLAKLSDAAKLQSRRAPRFFWRHPLAFILPRKHFQVRLKLFGKILIHTPNREPSTNS